MATPVRIHIAVTFDAGQAGMHGCRVSVLCHEYRHVHAIAGAGEFLVGVTRETIRIVLGQRRSRCQAENRGCGSDPAWSMPLPEESRIAYTLVGAQDSST